MSHVVDYVETTDTLGCLNKSQSLYYTWDTNFWDPINSLKLLRFSSQPLMVASTRYFRVRCKNVWLKQLQNKALKKKKKKFFYFIFLQKSARQCFACLLGHDFLISHNKRLSLYTGLTYLSNSCFFQSKGLLFYSMEVLSLELSL